MSTASEHPSLAMRVTEEQRDRAEQYLQQAYADGRVTEDEFDTRIGQVISATNRRELNDAFYGLVDVPASQSLAVSGSYAPAVRPGSVPDGRGVAGLAHFSGFVAPVVGPALFYALSSRGSYPRQEAAKAFNFQLVAVLLFLVTGGIAAATDIGFLAGLWAVTWFVLTIVGGAKALQGEDWRNPVRKVVKFEALPERPRT